jgi:hypothetical protein
MGFDDSRVKQIVERFRDYDEQQILDNAPHRHDMTRLIAASEQGRRDIAQLLAAEAASAPEIDRRDETEAPA